jgi:hypothetical protein
MSTRLLDLIQDSSKHSDDDSLINKDLACENVCDRLNSDDKDGKMADGTGKVACVNSCRTSWDFSLRSK